MDPRISYSSESRVDYTVMKHKLEHLMKSFEHLSIMISTNVIQLISVIITGYLYDSVV